MKTLEEFAPLLVFFALNARGSEWLGLPESQSLFIATGGFMLALAAVIVLGLARGSRPSQMTLVSAGFVFVFGGLTLILRDETFIKIKPTIVYLLFAGILAFGLVRGQSYLQFLMGRAVPLNTTGWLIFTKRWVLFFIAMAILNEIIWRSFTTDLWVAFKSFAVLPLTIGFILAQFRLFQTHAEKAS